MYMLLRCKLRVCTALCSLPTLTAQTCLFVLCFPLVFLLRSISGPFSLPRFSAPPRQDARRTPPQHLQQKQMEESSEKSGNGSHGAVPKFGGWESATMPTDYSMVFKTAREQRKQGGPKIEIHHHKINSTDDHDQGHLISHQHATGHSQKRTWLHRYFNCCIKA